MTLDSAKGPLEALRAPPVAGLQNLRDLGGYAGKAGTTRWRRAFRSEALHRMGPEGMSDLFDLGVGTVIDLRGARETALEPGPFAGGERPAYVNVPLFDALSPVDVGVVPHAFDMGERYSVALEECGESFARVFHAIAEAGEGAVLVHCAAGKDRTGLVAALWLLLADVPVEIVVEDYLATARQAGPLLEELKARNLARARLPAEVVARFFRCEPEMIGTFVDRLERCHGGATDYLRRAGLGECALARARRHLLA